VRHNLNILGKNLNRQTRDHADDPQLLEVRLHLLNDLRIGSFPVISLAVLELLLNLRNIR